MTRKATTIRLDPGVQAGLEKLSRLTRRPQNQLVNEAVEQLISRAAKGIIGDWQSTLSRLKAYRLRDPSGELSMTQAMDAEAALEFDPAEGVRAAQTSASGPISEHILKQLG